MGTSVACKVLPPLERPDRIEDILFILSSPKLGFDAVHDRRIRRQAECQDENDNCALFEEFCSDKYFSEVCPQTCGACEGKPVFGNLNIFWGSGDLDDSKDWTTSTTEELTTTLSSSTTVPVEPTTSTVSTTTEWSLMLTTSVDSSLFDKIRNVGYSAWNSATGWVTCYLG